MRAFHLLFTLNLLKMINTNLYIVDKRNVQGVFMAVHQFSVGHSQPNSFAIYRLKAQPEAKLLPTKFHFLHLLYDCYELA